MCISDWSSDVCSSDLTLIHEDMKKFFDGYPSKSHPMGQLAALVCSLSTFYPESLDSDMSEEEIDQTIIKLLAKMPTIVSWIFKKSMGHPYMYPKNSLDYVSNFPYMKFGPLTEEYDVDQVVVSAMHQLMILNAYHEKTCSPTTVPIVLYSNPNSY